MKFKVYILKKDHRFFSQATNSSLPWKMLFAIFLLSFLSCKKLVETDPPVTFTTSDIVYKDDATAAAVLTNIYGDLSSGANRIASGKYGISIRVGLSADELTLFSGSTDINMIQFYRNELLSASNRTFWENSYSILHTVNSAIEGLTSSSSLTPEVKQQLLGEALFMRALIHFYLVNLYGDVPLAITSDYRINSKVSRVATSEIYKQIVADLLEAKDKLSVEYKAANAMTNTEERVRPNKAAAIALLSRVYLYTGKWLEAENEATLIIDNTPQYDTTALNDVFLKNSKEAIWQLQPVNAGWNTEDARCFILTTAPNDALNPVYISNSLFDAFEPGDRRKQQWIESFTADTITYIYPYKYRSALNGEPVTEYLMVLRVGEQYLIRAEARARQGNIDGAVDDLNVLRIRAGLTTITGSTVEDVLSAIMGERRVELFAEWGHRWIDLKRTGTVNEVMTGVVPVKGGSWETTDQLYPLPATDILLNPNLVQNAGY